MMKRRFNASSLRQAAARRPALWTGLLIFFKFLLFDLCWSLPTTFAPFSTVEFYVTKLIATLLLLAPYRLFRLRRVEVVILFLLDALLVANLMYFRTYYTAIPLSSYLLGSNLTDFMGSVFDSLRWSDLLFPLSTLLAACGWLRRPSGEPTRRTPTAYWSLLATSVLLFAVVTASKGGFREAYKERRQNAYICANVTSIYTLFGGLCYDLLDSRQPLTPQARQEIDSWLSRRPAHHPLPDTTDVRNHCIVILAESLESWVLETEVEGQEITPCLNRLLREPTTLYAPHVLTQVKGGRSIDAQLLLYAGMLPISSGTYSSLYPDHTYYTLQKAMRQQKQARNYLLTIDKVSTWNQGVIARSFGTDTIIAYQDFELTEAFGTHKRTGDGSFLAQCSDKIVRGEIWPQGENACLQLVTYSGHAPFRLPEALKEVFFSERIPQKMNDYMTTAHYTDKAIGRFVEAIRQDPRYRETLIVITGDHEGLATYRQELCASEGGRGIVSPHNYTPFIVVNSPVGMRYEGVMGQIDMYPTLLNLLRLDSYEWTGLGQSILDPQKPACAVSPQLEVEGEAAPETIDHLRRAYEVSDQMIRFDYLGR